eukprot:CAMPEP_0172457642 /NCGR_PEP_ID=MMETSP1065-20121228/23245_1 /TAXON_ID=265537 /ORGANISM="Amphiprora paludosa, Strain CCMP125" /LENGTH=69 /DNA_ID=CAMNT_0013211495 /DNA_START=99 /DNA_END=308 /DNA_ORIENTATION=+
MDTTTATKHTLKANEEDEGLVTEDTILSIAYLLMFVFFIIGCAMLNCIIEERREKYYEAKRRAKKRQEK